MINRVNGNPLVAEPKISESPKMKISRKWKIPFLRVLRWPETRLPEVSSKIIFRLHHRWPSCVMILMHTPERILVAEPQEREKMKDCSDLIKIRRDWGVRSVAKLVMFHARTLLCVDGNGVRDGRRHDWLWRLCNAPEPILTPWCSRSVCERFVTKENYLPSHFFDFRPQSTATRRRKHKISMLPEGGSNMGIFWTISTRHRCHTVHYSSVLQYMHVVDSLVNP